MANEITFECKGYRFTLAQRKPNGPALIIVTDNDGKIQGWPYKNENSFVTSEDFEAMLDFFWTRKGAKMPDYE